MPELPFDRGACMEIRHGGLRHTPGGQRRNSLSRRLGHGNSLRKLFGQRNRRGCRHSRRESQPDPFGLGRKRCEKRSVAQRDQRTKRYAQKTLPALPPSVSPSSGKREKKRRRRCRQGDKRQPRAIDRCRIAHKILNRTPAERRHGVGGCQPAAIKKGVQKGHCALIL